MASPRIAVITPYHREPAAMLAQCHESVRAQTIAADHILVADGAPRGEVEGWKAAHTVLPRAHADNGNTPRGLGAQMAVRQDYDFVAFLDADNWYAPDHLASLHALWRDRQVAVCASFRNFHTLEGAVMAVSDSDEDAFRHVDTSCLMVHRQAFDALWLWLRMPRILSPICDRIFLAGVRYQRLAIASTGQRTVAFRSRYRIHYELAGLPAPPGAKDEAAFDPINAYLASASGVSECVAALGFWPLTYLQEA